MRPQSPASSMGAVRRVGDGPVGEGGGDMAAQVLSGSLRNIVGPKLVSNEEAASTVNRLLFTSRCSPSVNRRQSL